MGKDWTEDYPLEYWNKEKDIRKIHPAIKDFQTKIFESLKTKSFDGLKKMETIKMYKESVSEYKEKTSAC